MSRYTTYGLAPVLLLAVLAGCVSPGTVEAMKAEQRRQLSLECQAELMADGISVMHNAEAMYRYCERKARVMVP